MTKQDDRLVLARTTLTTTLSDREYIGDDWAILNVVKRRPQPQSTVTMHDSTWSIYYQSIQAHPLHCDLLYYSYPQG
jgi:hypothetical protein